MESKVKELINKLYETIDETKTLYEISETEMIYLVHIIMESCGLRLSPALTAKLLKAAAHFIETSYEASTPFFDELTKDKNKKG